MDDNNKNSYDDFFGKRPTDSNNDGGEQERNDRRQEHSASPGEEEKPSYYYTYGPFKRSASDDQSQERPDSLSASSPSRFIDHAQPIPPSQVQVTPPDHSRVYTPEAPSLPPKNNWQVKEKRRTSFRAMFASFMAGIVVIGGLMAVADNRNWFTFGGNEAVSGSHSEPAVNVSAGPGGSAANTFDGTRPNNIAAIFEKSSPAVVKINTFVNARSNSNNNGLDPFFRQFFGDGFNAPDSSQGGTNNGNGNGDGNGNNGGLVENGLGSGFIFEKEGYILTNQHVIANAAKIEVTVQGYAKPFEAKLLGSDYNLDLAVLKIEGDNLPSLKLGSSDSINIGDWVVAIGNPQGFDHTVTVGVLSAKERPISIRDDEGTRNYEHLLQTDASINPGNSGGPLLNTNGEVIGINTAISSSAQGIGFAIPTSTIKEVLDNLKANKEIPKPFIGAVLMDLNSDYAKQLGLDTTEGALVTNVYYNSPAYKGDLRQFDVIVGIDGTNYKTKEDLITEIKKNKVGDKITLNIIRNGKSLNLEVEIGDSSTFNAPQQPQQPQ
ncbi:trypsin-like peptidase domain-containing protein [Paenibacillus sp. GCM10012307]|uniref:Trypsin-like peptidase domain-containing protein n=1 Tax=Paenibacillus roseus TaxID=2798579 RepID=A0A934MVK1_9BACL|nr:trypsin-like peptidase domain-containing protein [Paenibacillus roseus]MBJ6362202.1 trypsin-like peptidase domain-containing protein [Paenibacillus roseus]